MNNSLLVLLAATLFLSLTAFECASTEFTTAKLAASKQEWAKAEENLRKEVAARPQNTDAWLLLASVYEKQEKYVEMNQTFDKVLALDLPADKKDGIVEKRFGAWSKIYNESLNLYNEDKNDEVLRKLDEAIRVGPEYPQSYFLKASTYQRMKDLPNETKTYKEYITLVKPTVDRGIAEGIALGMNKEQVIAKFGKPGEEDEKTGYAFYPAKNMAVYYRAEDGGHRVEGWRFVSPSDASLVRRIPYSISSAPYYTLGVDSYYEGEKVPARYNEALNYLQTVEKLDPQQEKVGQVIADIYVRTGRTAEGRSSFDRNIRENPTDPTLLIGYGNFLINLKDFRGAIGQYEKAMTVAGQDTSRYYQQALFNLGAAYKNWGASLQDSIKKVIGQRDPTKPQEEIVKAKLRDAVTQFEKLNRVRGSKPDFAALAELANLYAVLGESAKQKQLLSSLESLKSTDEGKTYSYWKAMGDLYVQIGDTKKAEDAYKRADEIGNR